MFGLKDVPPVFVSVASKGFSQAVSLLFATLAGTSISVAAKELRAIVGSDPDRIGADEWKSSVRRTEDVNWRETRGRGIGGRPEKESEVRRRG
jgi:hypothetical protein